MTFNIKVIVITLIYINNCKAFEPDKGSDMHTKAETPTGSRIEIKPSRLKIFFESIFKQGSVSEFSHSKGLPYSLVYNLVHGRISSLSARDYRIIFGEDPPKEDMSRVDGTFFRGMARLWLFLNPDVTEADLYREFYPEKANGKVDYRIFTGKTKTVDASLEKMMEDKFRAQALSTERIQNWIRELEYIEDGTRVDFEKIGPLLDYLEEKLGINPSRMLKQQVSRYESGELETVSKQIYSRALGLKERVEKALESGSRFKMEKLREEVYHAREGFVLFSELEEILRLLTKYGKKSSKRYLGRAISTYKKEKLRRIAAWRARRIREDWRHFIRQKPEVPLMELPFEDLKGQIDPFLYVLKSHLVNRLIQEGGEVYEQAVLMPSHPTMEKDREAPADLAEMDEAASLLNMDGKAFDLMVAGHSALLRKVAIHKGRWFLPAWYVAELKDKKEFDLIRAKYELLAGNTAVPSRTVTRTPS
jgi:hypothetical protein